MFAPCLLFLFVLSTSTLANDDPSLSRFRGHVVKNNDNYEIVTALENQYKEPLITDNVPATGYWDPTYNTTGWSVLEIETYQNQTNVEQVYAAGLLEGQFTRSNREWRFISR